MSSRTARVHRTLLARVALATLALALAIGAGAHRLGRSDLERAILAGARLRSDLLRQGVERRLAAGAGTVPEALAAELERPWATLPPAAAGRFVALLLADARGGELLRVARPGSGAIPWAPLRTAGSTPGEPGIRGRPQDGPRAWVAVALPFAPAGGPSGLELRAWFEPSAEALAALAARTRRSAALAAAAVVLTALLLYPIVRRLLERQARLSADLLDANLETLATLGSAIAKRDADTDAHNFRVVVYAARLAEALGLPDDLVRRLIKGAFVHDVGKIGIRDAVLLKPGRLEAEEVGEMRRHVEHGLEIVGRCFQEAPEALAG